MTIELLDPSELRVIIPGAHAFFEEGNIPGKLNEDHFIRTIRGFVESNQGFVVAGFSRDRTFLGALGGLVVRDFATGDLTGSELFWYVLPGQRTVGVRLFKAFEAECARRGAVRIHASYVDSYCSDRLGPIFKKWGYRPIERGLTKELL